MSQETLKKIMLGGAAIMFVLVAIAAFRSPSGAWPLCVAAIALLVFVNFDRIAKISASVTGAEVVMQQVENKVVELRRVVTAMARMNMAAVQRGGRWGSAFTHAEGEAIRQEAEELMRGVGVDDAEITKISQRGMGSLCLLRLCPLGFGRSEQCYGPGRVEAPAKLEKPRDTGRSRSLAKADRRTHAGTAIADRPISVLCTARPSSGPRSVEKKDC